MPLLFCIASTVSDHVPLELITVADVEPVFSEWTTTVHGSVGALAPKTTNTTTTQCFGP